MLCVLHSGTRNEVVVEGDTKFLTSSPDGKYLFAEGGIEMLQRMRVDGDVAVLEELSPRIGQNSQEIVVGSDSRLVAMPSGGGNYPVEGHPSFSYGTYIYDVENLCDRRSWPSAPAPTRGRSPSIPSRRRFTLRITYAN